MRALAAEMFIRHDDGQVTHFFCAQELDEIAQKRHLQMHYTLNVPDMNATDVTAFIKGEKKWIKSVLDSASNISQRLSVKCEEGA